MKNLFTLSLLLIAAVVFFLSLEKSKKNGFYADTPWLIPLGIFVWGDGLILGPLWMVSALVFYWLSPLNILRYFLLFFAIRSSYEVIYWINHQVAKKDYRPPLFRHISWLGANEAAILYQLLNMSWVVLNLAGLLATFIF